MTWCQRLVLVLVATIATTAQVTPRTGLVRLGVSRSTACPPTAVLRTTTTMLPLPLPPLNWTALLAGVSGLPDAACDPPCLSVVVVPLGFTCLLASATGSATGSDVLTSPSVYMMWRLTTCSSFLPLEARVASDTERPVWSPAPGLDYTTCFESSSTRSTWGATLASLPPFVVSMCSTPLAPSGGLHLLGPSAVMGASVLLRSDYILPSLDVVEHASVRVVCASTLDFVPPHGNALTDVPGTLLPASGSGSVTRGTRLSFVSASGSGSGPGGGSATVGTWHTSPIVSGTAACARVVTCIGWNAYTSGALELLLRDTTVPSQSPSPSLATTPDLTVVASGRRCTNDNGRGLDCVVTSNGTSSCVITDSDGTCGCAPPWSRPGSPRDCSHCATPLWLPISDSAGTGAGVGACRMNTDVDFCGLGLGLGSPLALDVDGNVRCGCPWPLSYANASSTRCVCVDGVCGAGTCGTQTQTLTGVCVCDPHWTRGLDGRCTLPAPDYMLRASVSVPVRVLDVCLGRGVDVSASRDAGTCVYTSTCFDPAGPGCADAVEACGVGVDTSASLLAGACVCTPGYGPGYSPSPVATSVPCSTCLSSALCSRCPRECLVGCLGDSDLCNCGALGRPSGGDSGCDTSRCLDGFVALDDVCLRCHPNCTSQNGVCRALSGGSVTCDCHTHYAPDGFGGCSSCAPPASLDVNGACVDCTPCRGARCVSLGFGTGADHETGRVCDCASVNRRNGDGGNVARCGPCLPGTTETSDGSCVACTRDCGDGTCVSGGLCACLPGVGRDDSGSCLHCGPGATRLESGCVRCTDLGCPEGSECDSDRTCRCASLGLADGYLSCGEPLPQSQPQPPPSSETSSLECGCLFGAPCIYEHGRPRCDCTSVGRSVCSTRPEADDTCGGVGVCSNGVCDTLTGSCIPFVHPTPTWLTASYVDTDTGGSGSGSGAPVVIVWPGWLELALGSTVLILAVNLVILLCVCAGLA